MSENPEDQKTINLKIRDLPPEHIAAAVYCPICGHRLGKNGRAVGGCPSLAPCRRD